MLASKFTALEVLLLLLLLSLSPVLGGASMLVSGAAPVELPLLEWLSFFARFAGGAAAAADEEAPVTWASFVEVVEAGGAGGGAGARSYARHLCLSFHSVHNASRATFDR